MPLEASISRPDPEMLLRQVQAEEEYAKRGRLKIFLGYMSGVGKSQRMFNEGYRRLERGEDVVVGAAQPGNCPEVEELLRKMEVIRPHTVGGMPAMNVEAILKRHPQVCLIDGVAYNNPPGSLHDQRWQDVEQLLAAGISVIASVNLQYIEERREQVEKITGKKVNETIPLPFVQSADEIEVVDAPAELCLERADDSSGKEAAPSPEQLSELRELALLLAADVVDRQLGSYLERHGIEPRWGAQERILVCLRPCLDAQKIIESGRRNADRFHGELFVVYTDDPHLSPEDRDTLDANLTLARELNANIEPLDGQENPVAAIIEFARSHGVTQIFIGHSTHANWWQRLWGNSVDRLIRDAEGIDVRVFPN